MSQQSSGPAGPGSGDWPDEQWPDDQWPDDRWPDDRWPDDRWPDDIWSGEDDDGVAGDGWPAPPISPGPPGDGSAKRRVNPTALAVTAVVAVVAGAAIALAVEVFSPSSTPSAPAGGHQFILGPRGGSQPGAGGRPGTGGRGSGPVGGFPGGGGSGQTGQAFVVGRLLKVSATSITVGGPGHTITAAVTRSTRVSGKVSAISGLKVGDQVSAQISQSGGKATVVAIQYPAQIPAGGFPSG
jgi:hypothetical protein